MNVFTELAVAEHANDSKLGMPSASLAHFDRRMTLMKRLTKGNGFRVDPKEPVTRANGKTRGEMKREARAAAEAKVGLPVAAKHLHSAARRRLDAEHVLRMAA